MHDVKVRLASMSGSPFSFSKAYATPKKEGESHDAYEQRTWRERVHADEDNECFIPANMFSQAIKNAAGYTSVKVPGARSRTYTKHIKSGVIPANAGVALKVKKDKVPGETLYVPAQPGNFRSGTRVYKTFPVVKKWAGDVEFIVLDDAVTPKVFLYHLQQAGRFIGVGRWRPQNGGANGRFSVEGLEWDGKKVKVENITKSEIEQGTH